MAVRMADTAEPMGDFPIAKAKHIEFEDGEKLQEKLDNGTLGSGGGTPYDDTEVRALIDTNKTNITDLSTKIGTTAMGTTATDVTGAVAEVNGNLLDTVSFSADYKNIVLNRKNGTNPYTIPISAIINNSKIVELGDVDVTDIGNGKTLIYDAASQKHKYVDSTGTDELVKMDAAADAHYLVDLIDKQTVVNDNGTLKVKMLDGQDVTITEINYLKGLTMNVMDLVNTFANGGVKVLNTPVATHADLATLDRSTFIEGISYIVYVLADETHAGAKTTYLCDKTSETYFGNADSQRNFTTDPIDLANEVTGKLPAKNIDVDSLWALLSVDDTYKTLTATDKAFGTHGAKAMYDELVAAIGDKANATDLTTHTDDTDIHVTTVEKDTWNNKEDSANKTTKIDGTSTDVEYPTAKAVHDIVPFKFGIDENGNYGYYKAGADTVTPFKKGEFIGGFMYSNNITLPKQGIYIVTSTSFSGSGVNDSTRYVTLKTVSDGVFERIYYGTAESAGYSMKVYKITTNSDNVICTYNHTTQVSVIRIM